MRQWTIFAILAISWSILGCASSFAQQDQPDSQTESQRKVVNKVAPPYPSLARNMHLRGIVRLEAQVGANGTVKGVKVIGGNPVLAQAAESAIHKWKWAPASKETEEPIEIRFDSR